MPNPDYESMRRAMVDSQLRTSGVTEAWVLAALGSAPRETYVPAEYAATCYTDRPVPLGNGRAVNPPLVTALMLQAAAISAQDTILLVADASGYVAHAIKQSGAKLTAVDEGEGAAGGKPGSYDLIFIDGAIEALPDALLAQAKEGARIVTGISDGAVTRLATGTVRDGRVALLPFADAEIVRLPAFARPKEFAF